MKKKRLRSQKSKISISPEYSDMVPKLTDAEYEALKQSIKDDGQHMPIIANDQGIVLDGHHRYKACTELGVEPKVATMKFKTKDEEKLFVITSNLDRRQLNAYQRAVLALEKKPVLANIAKVNMRQGRVSQIKETLHVDKRLAKEAGMSTAQLYKVEKIEKEGSEELKELARTDKLSINRAYALIGKDVNMVLAFDFLQKTVDNIADSISSMPPGSEQEQAALRYIENFGHVVNSIPDDDWASGDSLKTLTGAVFGGGDGMIAMQFCTIVQSRLPPELVLPAFELDDGERAVFSSVVEKLKKYPPFMVTFSEQERTLLLKIIERIASTAKRLLGSSA